jgi:hypothetical protein
MLNVVMLTITMLSVVMLNVVLLSAVARSRYVTIVKRHIVNAITLLLDLLFLVKCHSVVSLWVRHCQPLTA